MSRLDGEGTLRERPDGRWEGRIRLPDGRRRSVYGSTPDEANGKRQDILEALRKDLPIPSTRITVGEFLQGWLERRRGRIRPSTYSCYSSTIRNHIVPTIGHIRLTKLTPRQVDKMLADLATSGRKKRKASRADGTEDPAGLAPRTVQLARAVLREALQQALAWGEVHRNVAALTEGPRVEREPVNPWDADEIASFLAGIAGDRLEALYIAALALGLRQGELVGLRWQDVDLDAGELRVVQARDRRTGTFGPPKSAKSRRVLALPEVAIDAIRAHGERQELEQEAMGPGWNPLGLVFVTSNGTPYDGSNVATYFRRHVARLGLRPCRFHDLRHASASLLLAQGISLREIMETLGHSQIALTANTYTHILPAMRRNVAASMDVALRPAKGRGGQIGGQLRLVR